jgi:hypothetical protein
MCRALLIALGPMLTLGCAPASADESLARPTRGREPVMIAQQPAEAPAPLDLARLRELRQQAAHRRRRIIFNNDGDDVIYTKKEPTAEALLALRTTPLLGSQVDSIFYSNSLCFGHALHNSRVMEPFTCTEAMFADNGLPQLMARGIDPIQVMVEFGHANGIEIFWDMRMNDTHDAMIGGYGPYLRPRFKLDHPEFLVGCAEKPPPYGPWSSVNYAEPEVRDLAYRFFEEVCSKFDVDGIELDFLRHACFFKSVAEGGRASQAELDMMTDLVRRTREMTEREGLRRGRPILIAIRVPDSVEYCRAIGLDVERWLSEGLVDLLIGSCYFQLNPWEYLVDLGHRHNVPVYPSLSESRVQAETRFSRNSLESYRARALWAWTAGADGIYIFNYFNPKGALWRELGDPETLRGKDKLYFVTVRDGSPDSYLAGGREYQHLPVLTPTKPSPVPVGEPTQIDLPVGDDLVSAQRAGLKPQVTCHVRLLGGSDVEVALNGHPLTGPTPTDQWLDFPVSPEWVIRGHNHLALSAPAPPPAAGDAEWTTVCEGSEMPSLPWQRMGFGEGCVAEVQDGKLLIADRSTAGGSYAFFQYPCFIRPEDETVIEARLKTLSGWSSIMVENGTAGEEIQFHPDRVTARYCGLTYAMDTTDAFHTYRIVLQGDSFRVYVHGELRLDGAGKFTRPAWNGRSGVMFGAANSPSTGEALWESVRIRNRALTLLDLALSIKYGA